MLTQSIWEEFNLFNFTLNIKTMAYSDNEYFGEYYYYEGTSVNFKAKYLNQITNYLDELDNFYDCDIFIEEERPIFARYVKKRPQNKRKIVDNLITFSVFTPYQICPNTSLITKRDE